MKIASKVLLILELIGLCLLCLVQAALGGACVIGTWYAQDIETYILCYRMSYVLLINLAWYVLPLIFTIYGLCKVSHHKDGNHYLLAGILTAIFAGLIPGILMIVDASDEKVEEAEDALIDEIYGHDECCHHDHDEDCECKCECVCEEEKVEKSKKHHLFHKKDEEVESKETEEVSEKDGTSIEEEKEPKVETMTSGNVEIEVVDKNN